VLENGRRLSVITGAKIGIVELFAVFHDSQRINEGFGNDHGRRGAKLARDMHGIQYELDDGDLELLIQACELHTEGYLEGDTRHPNLISLTAFRQERALIREFSFYEHFQVAI
jgi:uncharacterized protein